MNAKTIKTAMAYAALGTALLETVAAEIQADEPVEMDDETRFRIVLCLKAAAELIEGDRSHE